MIGEIFKNIGKEISTTSDVNRFGHRVDISKRLDLNDYSGKTGAEKSDISKRISSEKINEVGRNDPVLKSINRILESPDSIKELINSLPDSGKTINTLKQNIDIINDPNSSVLERNNANRIISPIKGDLLEQATKKSLEKVGLDVKQNKEKVKGESRDTYPDVVAVNNTKKTIVALGRKIKPGETISAECKCGEKTYLSRELQDHIPNQLSGQSGERTLITTSDVANVKDLAEDVCKKYDAKLASIDISNQKIIDNLKGAIA